MSSLAQLIDLQTQIFKTSLSAAQEPFRDRTSGDFPFETDGYGGFGGEDYWEDSGSPENPVILSHGLGRTAYDMKRIGEELLENGYNGDEIYSITYDSFLPCMERGAQQLHHLTDSVLEYTGTEEVDIIGHSMGGLIPRYMLYQEGEENVGTVLTLGAPDNGSAWNEMLQAHQIPQAPEISKQSAKNGKLDKLNKEDLDTEIVSVRGENDSAYPLQRASGGYTGDKHVVLNRTHATLKKPETVAELVEEHLQN